MTHKGAKMVTGLFVAALMAAFLMPVAIGAVTNPDTVSATQSTGETITLQGDLTATLDSVNSDTNATYTLSNDAGSDTVTVAEGSTETATVGDTDVSVTLESAGSSSADTTYEYPKTYGWGDGASSLWLVIPIMMVLGVFLLFVGIALKVTR